MTLSADSKIEKAVEIAKKCGKILSDKKAAETVIMDVRGVSTYFDIFIIATANSHIHCRSLAVELRKYLKSTYMSERSRTDFNSGWIIIDFDEIVVHIFTKETKDYYQLEKLWSDAEYIEF